MTVDIPINPQFACPWCDGTGRYAFRFDITGPQRGPCFWCGGTGDKREIPPEKKRGMVER